MLGRTEKYFSHEGIGPLYEAVLKNEAFLDRFEALTPHILVGTEKNHENSQAAEMVVSGPRFELVSPNHD